MIFSTPTWTLFHTKSGANRRIQLFCCLCDGEAVRRAVGTKHLPHQHKTSDVSPLSALSICKHKTIGKFLFCWPSPFGFDSKPEQSSAIIMQLCFIYSFWVGASNYTLKSNIYLFEKNQGMIKTLWRDFKHKKVQLAPLNIQLVISMETIANKITMRSVLSKLQPQ